MYYDDERNLGPVALSFSTIKGIISEAAAMWISICDDTRTHNVYKGRVR